MNHTMRIVEKLRVNLNAVEDAAGFLDWDEAYCLQMDTLSLAHSLEKALDRDAPDDPAEAALRAYEEQNT